MSGFGFGSRRRARRRLAASVSLNALTLSASSVAENSAQDTVVGSVQGKMAGSVLSLIGTAGGRFALDGSNRIVTGATALDYETGTSHGITIRETLAGATNSPRDTALTITVTDMDEVAPVLSTPTGSATGATTANIGVTSDEANGTLYWSILPAASAAPNAAAFLGGTTGGVATGSTASPNAGSNGFSPSGLTSETAYKAHFLQQDAAGNNSNVVSSGSFTTADVTAPTLSSPVDSANGSTGATLAVTTTEGNGTLYFYLSTSATPPSAADLKAGTGAVASGSQSVSAPGVQNVTGITGLTASTTYYAHMLHRDAATNESAIVSGDGFTTSAGGADPYSPVYSRPTPTGTVHTVTTADSAATIAALYASLPSGDCIEFDDGTYDAVACFPNGFNRAGVIIRAKNIGAYDADPMGGGNGVHWSRFQRMVVFEIGSGMKKNPLTAGPNIISAANVTIHDIHFTTPSGLWPAQNADWDTVVTGWDGDRAALIGVGTSASPLAASNCKVMFCEFSVGYGTGKTQYDPASNAYTDYTDANNRIAEGPIACTGTYHKAAGFVWYGNYVHDITGGLQNMHPASGIPDIRHNWYERVYHDVGSFFQSGTSAGYAYTAFDGILRQQNVTIDSFSNSADAGNPHADDGQVAVIFQNGGTQYRVKNIKMDRNFTFAHATTRGTGIQMNFVQMVSGTNSAVVKAVSAGLRFRENIMFATGTSHAGDTSATESAYVRGNIAFHPVGQTGSVLAATRITADRYNGVSSSQNPVMYYGGNIMELAPTRNTSLPEVFSENNYHLGWRTGRTIADTTIFQGAWGTSYPTNLHEAYEMIKRQAGFGTAGPPAANIREFLLAPLDFTGETPFLGFATLTNQTPTTLTTSGIAWPHGGDDGDVLVLHPVDAGIEFRTLLASDYTTVATDWTTADINVTIGTHVVQARMTSAAQDGVVTKSYTFGGKAFSWTLFSTVTAYPSAAFDVTANIAQPANSGSGTDSPYCTIGMEIAIDSAPASAKDILNVVAGTAPVRIQLLAGRQIRVIGNGLSATSTFTLPADGTYHTILIAIDLTAASGAAAVQMYKDNALDTSATVSYTQGLNLLFSTSVKRKVGGSHPFHLRFMHVLPRYWLDLADPLIRNKYSMVNAGADGSGVNGVQPSIFLIGDVTHLTQASPTNVNYGTLSMIYNAPTIS